VINPVFCQNCTYVFCERCFYIAEHKIEGEDCPKKEQNMRKLNEKETKLYESIKAKCFNANCNKIISIKEFLKHYNECEYR
jgi:hypothetical protein